MQYRFAAFDLDGTLLNDKKELTPKTRAALAQLQARGVRLIRQAGAIRRAFCRWRRSWISRRKAA